MEMSMQLDIVQVVLTFFQALFTLIAILIAYKAVKLSQKWAETTLKYQHNKMLREHFLEHIVKLTKISNRHRADLRTPNPARKIETVVKLMGEITLVHNLALAGIAADDPDFKAFEAITPMIDSIEKLRVEFVEVQSESVKNEEEVESQKHRLRELAVRIDSETMSFLKYIDPANRKSTITTIPRDLSTQLHNLLNR